MLSVHGAAPFLAWHRYFLHIYEQALKEECGYQSHMVYVGSPRHLLQY
jgi:tyrosinase